MNYENYARTDSIYTKVQNAVEFVKQTNVDSLAVSVETAHSIYKRIPKLNFDRLHKLDQVFIFL